MAIGSSFNMCIVHCVIWNLKYQLYLGHIEGCEILSEEVSNFLPDWVDFCFYKRKVARFQFIVIGLVLSLIVHDQFSL